MCDASKINLPAFKAAFTADDALPILSKAENTQFGYYA